MHTRDQLVQRRIYTVPNTGTQFVVHEWRPRFGMGHDPSTHQVWVKITGLPLQAWTTPQISAILQEFGLPLHVLPFGRKTGHYRNITALVSTKNPDNILMRYTYREGDYSVRVDITILASRLTQQGYFPPPSSPEDPQFGRDSPNGTQQQNINGSSSQYRSAASSSSNHTTPSEPTIDLSSWSPRSYKVWISSDGMIAVDFDLNQFPLLLTLFTKHPYHPSFFLTPSKKYLPLRKEDKRKAVISQALSNCLPSLLDSTGARSMCHSLATEDPVTQKIPLQAQPTMRPFSLHTPSPIPITLLAARSSATYERTADRGRSITCFTFSDLQYGEENVGNSTITIREKFMSDINHVYGQLAVSQPTRSKMPSSQPKGSSTFI